MSKKIGKLLSINVSHLCDSVTPNPDLVETISTPGPSTKQNRLLLPHKIICIELASEQPSKGFKYSWANSHHNDVQPFKYSILASSSNRTRELWDLLYTRTAYWTWSSANKAGMFTFTLFSCNRITSSCTSSNEAACGLENGDSRPRSPFPCVDTVYFQLERPGF